MKKHRKLPEKLLEAKGYAGNVGQLDKGYDLQGKVTYSATPLALEAHFEHFWTQGYERNSRMRPGGAKSVIIYEKNFGMSEKAS